VTMPKITGAEAGGRRRIAVEQAMN
jgi:hypothetical protein